jgi:hypothetical protein
MMMCEIPYRLWRHNAHMQKCAQLLEFFKVSRSAINTFNSIFLGLNYLETERKKRKMAQDPKR